MKYLNQKELLEIQKNYSGKLSQEALVLIGEIFAKEIIEARGDRESLSERLTFIIDSITDLNITQGYEEGTTQQLLTVEKWKPTNPYILEALEDSENFNPNKDEEDNINSGAFGKSSVMLGGESQSAGDKSITGGSKNLAFGENSEAFGVETLAKGKNSFTQGDSTTALGEDAFAEGGLTLAGGMYSHAQNRKAKATGKSSHAQNYDTLAQGESSTAMGVQTKAYQKACVAEGCMSEAGLSTEESDTLNPARASGMQTKARGFASNAKGQFTEADGTAASSEGSSTKAKADFCHTEGSGTIAYKPACHSEGGSTISGEIPKEEYVPIAYPENEIDPKTFVPETGGSSSGTEGGTSQEKDWGSHSEGLNTRALAMAAHSEGEMTIAYKYASHAGGIGTIANTIAQYVHGLYNLIDEAQKYLHIVGNGKSDKKRSNAYTLDWDGNGWFAGDVEAKGVILSSPNGSRFKLTVSDNGELKTTKL